jgi:O-antigen/teichoic acid export membrane protein
LAALLLIVYVGANSTSALAGYLIASCLVFLSQLHQLRRHFPAAFSKHAAGGHDYLGQFVTYGWPFSVWGIFAAVQLSADRWILGYSLNNRSVGIYTAAYQLGFSPIMLLATAASVFISPILFSRAGDGSDPVRVRAALKLNWAFVGITAAVSALAALATYLLRVPLVRVLCGHGYEEASRYLPGLVIAAGLFACGQIATHALLIHRNTKALIAPKVVTGILAFALYILCARMAGIYGIVLANVTWTLVYFLWVMRLSLTASAKMTCAEAG